MILRSPQDDDSFLSQFSLAIFDGIFIGILKLV